MTARSRQGRRSLLGPAAVALLAFGFAVAVPSSAFAQPQRATAGSAPIDAPQRGGTGPAMDARSLPGGGGFAGAGTGTGMQGTTDAPREPGSIPGGGRPGQASAGTGAGMQGSTDAPVDAGSIPGGARR